MLDVFVETDNNKFYIHIRNMWIFIFNIKPETAKCYKNNHFWQLVGILVVLSAN